jgi:hypothetical protein
VVSQLSRNSHSFQPLDGTACVRGGAGNACADGVARNGCFVRAAGTYSGEAGVDGGGGGLLHDPAEHGKHGNAAVLELSLAEHLHVEHLGEAKGVEANVTRERAVEVGGLLEEGDRVRVRAREHSHLGGSRRCTHTRHAKHTSTYMILSTLRRHHPRSPATRRSAPEAQALPGSAEHRHGPSASALQVLGALSGCREQSFCILKPPALPP